MGRGVTGVGLETPLQPQQGKEREVGKRLWAITSPWIEMVEECVPSVQGVEDPEIGAELHGSAGDGWRPVTIHLHLQPQEPFIGPHGELRRGVQDLIPSYVYRVSFFVETRGIGLDP